MSKPEHILLGTDFSRGARVAMEAACEQARAFGAKLTVLHAYSAALDLVDPNGVARQRMEIGEEVHKLLAAIKQECDGRVRELHTEVVPCESPVDTICEFARGHGVDLIVLGAHGRSDIKSLLVGSTVERVARHAPCAVLVAR